MFAKLIKQRIEEEALQNLENRKKCHSKVEKIEHNYLILQKYLQPNMTNITKEEAQLIFKLRCRMTNLKCNFKGNYDTLECRVCKIEEENQEHVINKCKKLNEDTEELDYKKIFNGTVTEKLRIARKFKINFEKLEKMKS